MSLCSQNYFFRSGEMKEQLLITDPNITIHCPRHTPLRHPMVVSNLREEISFCQTTDCQQCLSKTEIGTYKSLRIIKNTNHKLEILTIKTHSELNLTITDRTQHLFHKSHAYYKLFHKSLSQKEWLLIRLLEYV